MKLKKNIGKKLFKGILDGSILTKEIVIKQLPFVFFLTVLAIVYIANSYHAEKIARQIIQSQKEIKELRTESVTIAWELTSVKRQSVVNELIEKHNLDIKIPDEPPKKIVVKAK